MLIRILKKNINIGKNNKISPKAILHNDIIIGDNNFIGDNVIIYPNTKIGNNNQIFKGNIIGEFPVNSDDDYKIYDIKKSKGVDIGDNNLFHVNNLIFGGAKNKTLIGNNNKFLAENHCGHDVIIKDNVTFYPRVIQGGHSIYLNNSNVGAYAFIQQKTVVGQFSMIGSQSALTKNAFPYFVNINNKITRLNTKKIDEDVIKNELLLKEIYELILKKENISELISKLPLKIINEINIYLDNIKINI